MLEETVMKLLRAFVVISTCLVVLCSSATYGPSFGEFQSNWCKQRKWRVDWEGFKESCDKFEGVRGDLQKQAEAFGKDLRTMYGTDPHKIRVHINEKPAGEFSQLFIKSYYRSGEVKTFGGDAWRVRLNGPSTIDGTVFDLGNGTYEVLFLVMETGEYNIEVTLDYTVCDGIRDPPMEWFKSAHCTDPKKNADLNKELCADMKQYINQRIAINKSITISQSGVSEPVIQTYMRRAESECGLNCNLMWDGFGRWVNNTFQPYMNYDPKDYSTPGRPLFKSYNHQTSKGILWVYGDSLGLNFYEALRVEPMRILCQTVFKNCSNTYNWIYPKEDYSLIETCAEVNLNVTRVVGFLRQVLHRPDMDKDSAFLFNAGAHFVKTTDFDMYRQVIDAVIVEAKQHYKGKFVWKSTTAMHEQTAEIMGAFRRFITNQRTQLYNAYANSAMCTNGMTILDVYPVTASHPDGTKDGIHYHDSNVFPSVFSLLENYFSS